MIRLMTLRTVKHEEEAIYMVNQRIPNVLEVRELLTAAEHFVVSESVKNIYPDIVKKTGGS